MQTSKARVSHVVQEASNKWVMRRVWGKNKNRALLTALSCDMVSLCWCFHWPALHSRVGKWASHRSSSVPLETSGMKETNKTKLEHLVYINIFTYIIFFSTQVVRILLLGIGNTETLSLEMVSLVNNHFRVFASSLFGVLLFAEFNSEIPFSCIPRLNNLSILAM